MTLSSLGVGIFLLCHGQSHVKFSTNFSFLSLSGVLFLVARFLSLLLDENCLAFPFPLISIDTFSFLGILNISTRHPLVLVMVIESGMHRLKVLCLSSHSWTRSNCSMYDVNNFLPFSRLLPLCSSSPRVYLALNATPDALLLSISSSFSRGSQSIIFLRISSQVNFVVQVLCKNCG